MTTVYLLHINYSRLSRGWVAEECNRASLVTDILSGEFTGEPLKIIEVIPDEGTSRDVSEDIAYECAAVARDRGIVVTPETLDFIENQCGVRLGYTLPAAE